MAITYTKKGDYYYPNLIVSEHDYPPIGKYGMLRKSFLKEHRRAQYNWMVWQDTLWPHLLEVDKQAQAMVNRIVQQMAEAEGVNEDLKARDQMKWIGLMNNFRHCAEEIVLPLTVYA